MEELKKPDVRMLTEDEIIVIGIKVAGQYVMQLCDVIDALDQGEQVVVEIFRVPTHPTAQASLESHSCASLEEVRAWVCAIRKDPGAAGVVGIHAKLFSALLRWGAGVAGLPALDDLLVVVYGWDYVFTKREREGFTLRRAALVMGLPLDDSDGACDDRALMTSIVRKIGDA